MMNNCFLSIRRTPLSKNYTKNQFFLLYRKKSGFGKTSTHTSKQQVPACIDQGSIGWGYLGEEP